MANTFKVVTFAAEPASAGTPYKMYTCAGSTTTVVLDVPSNKAVELTALIVATFTIFGVAILSPF